MKVHCITIGVAEKNLSMHDTMEDHSFPRHRRSENKNLKAPHMHLSDHVPPALYYYYYYC